MPRSSKKKVPKSKAGPKSRRPCRGRAQPPAPPEDRLDEPDLADESDVFLRRRCDGRACCQATTASGELCRRPAIGNGRTYFPQMKCCLLCWQHARIAGMGVAMHAVDKGSKFMLTPEQRRDLKAWNIASDGK